MEHRLDHELDREEDVPPKWWLMTDEPAEYTTTVYLIPAAGRWEGRVFRNGMTVAVTEGQYEIREWAETAVACLMGKVKREYEGGQR